MAKNLLLISNSKHRAHPGKFLAYCEPEIKEFLGGIKNLLFIPYAEPNDTDKLIMKERRDAGDDSLRIPSSTQRYDAYTRILRSRFAELGFNLDGIHEDSQSPTHAIENATAVYVGGGNTFDLLHTLYTTEIIPLLRERINAGMPYLGVSAGSVIAGMNICSSNDNTKPIPAVDTLQLLPFCIKPHYQEKVVVSDEVRSKIEVISPEVLRLIDYQGESHADRTQEFHHTFPYTVVGLREGSMLRVQGNSILLQGYNNARILRAERMMAEYEPKEEYSPGTSLDFLLNKI